MNTMPLSAKGKFPLFALIWVSLPLVWVVPFWVSLLFGAMIVVSVFRSPGDLKNHRRRFFRWVLLPAYLLLLIQYRPPLQYEPAMALALLATAFLVCIRRKQRDIRWAAMLMLFLVAGATLFTQNIFMVTHLLFSFLWIGLILLETSRGGPMFASIFDSGAQLLTYLFAALPVIALIYYLFPRYEEALFSIYRFNGHGRTGISGEVYPGSVSKIIEDETPAFRAYLDATVRMEDLYWRVLTLSYSDGHKWRESILDRNPPGGDGKLPDRQLAGMDARLGQRILLDPVLKNYLVGLDIPERIDSLSDRAIRVQRAGSQTFRLTRETHSKLSYCVVSRIRQNSCFKDSPEKIHYWLPVPLSKEMRRLVSDWKRESLSQEEYLQNVLQYFSTHLSYTLMPGTYDEKKDFLTQFLLKRKMGFCEHFASALALLARSDGIPSRLVVGYQGGTYNPHGKYWVVRQKNAHVWVELFFKNKGWTRIDPTAYVAPERIRTGGYPMDGEGWRRYIPYYSGFMDITLRLDDLNTRWNDLLLEMNRSLQEKFFQGGMSSELKYYQFGGMLIFATSIVIYLLLILARRELLKWKRRGVDEELIGIYKRVLRKLAKRGIFKRPSEGPLEFLKRIEGLDKNLAAGSAPFFKAYLELRYGPEMVIKARLQHLMRIAKAIK